MIYAAIMAGGAGTRLWPLSRQKKPKQLHALIGDKTMLVESVERLAPMVTPKNIFIGTTAELLDACRKALPELKSENFFVEPVMRNTGPAVGLAAAILAKRDPEAVIAALWSDHHIGRPEEFRNVLALGEQMIQKHPAALLTIGIAPQEPSTAYGYIQRETQSEQVNGHKIYPVRQFVEKPDQATAERYIKSGDYFWNAGYFVFRAATMLTLFQKHAPEIYKGLLKIQAALGTKEEQRVIKEEFEKFPNAPLDTLIAEKAPLMYVIPAELEWSDIGSWSSLHDVLSSPKNGNIVTKGHHLSHGDENILVYAKDKLIVTIGLKDIVIVETDDAILIAHKDQSQKVKNVIEQLKQEGKHQYL